MNNKIVGKILSATVFIITYLFVAALLIPLCIYILTLSVYTVDYSTATMFALVMMGFLIIGFKYLWKWHQGYGGELRNYKYLRVFTINVSNSKITSKNKRLLLLSYGAFMFVSSFVYLTTYIFKLIYHLQQ